MATVIRWLMLLSLSLVSGGAAWGADLADVVAALERGYRGLADVEAEFTQRAAIAGIGREQKGSGTLAFLMAQGTTRFRFDYRAPQRQQIVSDGKTVWLYQPDNRQVLVSDLGSMTAGGNGLAMTYLAGLGDVSRDFSVSLAGGGRDPRGNYLLELVPKKKSRLLAKLRLTVNGSAVDARADGAPPELFPLSSATVIDGQGNRTTLEFARIRTNQGLSPSRFTFRPPAGTEVIRPGRSGAPN